MRIVPTSLQISFQEQLSRDHGLPRNSRLGDIKHKVKVTETHFSRWSWLWLILIRLESVVYPLFTEPTHMVVFDIAFKRETYFDGSFGVLVKVSRRTKLKYYSWYFFKFREAILQNFDVFSILNIYINSLCLQIVVVINIEERESKQTFKLYSLEYCTTFTFWSL